MKPITQFDLFGRKECSQCRRLLPLEQFVPDPRKKRGVTSNCRDCRAKAAKRWGKREAKRISERNRSPETRAYMRAWWATNGEAIKARRRDKAKTPEGREKSAAKQRRLRRGSPQHRVRMNLRSRVNAAVRAGYKSGSTEALLGCTVAEFVGRIEAQWSEGMSWENYGIGEGMWNIDHIRPCASFDLADPAQQKECFHYSNCRPMWALENCAKGHKFVEVDA
jgi:hypothetical protein